METKKEKVQSEFCVEEIIIILQLRLKLLLRRVGETEGKKTTQAEDSTPAIRLS